MSHTEKSHLISQNLSRVREKMKIAADSSKRDISEIDLMVVTKTRDPEIISIVIDNNISLLGENRIQEAVPKIGLLNQRYPELQWHMIGHLQSNKAGLAVESFDSIQSVDSVKIANKISDIAVQRNIRKDIMLEINISGETSKFGFDPDTVPVQIKPILELPGINLTGLMTIGPLTFDQDKIRSAFQDMKKLFDRLGNIHPENMKHLSMGMSDDYDIAIEEGATMIRLGRAVFGPGDS